MCFALALRVAATVGTSIIGMTMHQTQVMGSAGFDLFQRLDVTGVPLLPSTCCHQLTNMSIALPVNQPIMATGVFDGALSGMLWAGFDGRPTAAGSWRIGTCPYGCGTSKSQR